MALDILKKARQEVAQTGADLTKPSTTGGGSFTPADIGPTRLRLVGYVETGIHESGGQYKKVKPRAEISFELSGPKHEPKRTDDGKVIPFRVTAKEIVGTHAKNGYIKLFNILNVDGDARNFLDLMMDKAWLGTVSHWKPTGSDRVIAQLKDGGMYQIRPTTFPDPETGELRRVAVPPAVSEPRVFIWDHGDLEQWDTLLDFQKNKIRAALNFEGSPIYLALVEAGRSSELAPTEREGEKAPDDTPDDDDPPAPPAGAQAKAKPAKAPASPTRAPKAPAKGKAAQRNEDPLAGLDDLDDDIPF